MARLNHKAASSDIETAGASSVSGRHRSVTSETPPSDLQPAHSDKENPRSSKQPRQHIGKRSSRTVPMSEHGDIPESSRKKQKLDRRPKVQPSQAAHRRELQERVDTTYYDPDQDEDVRRATKKGLRDLFSKVNDSRAEYLQPGSKGIEDTLEEADKIYQNVKQTSVATIDSRLLVTIGDLAYKKVNTLTLGDSSLGVDVDDFVSKCISFMNEGTQADGSANDAASSSTQNRGRRKQVRPAGDDDDNNDEDTEPLNWAHLGKNACFLYNRRPCLSSFLLGPLSVQKKTRQQTQRKAREARADPSQATRPLALEADDLEEQESTNLTVICSKIAHLLENYVKDAEVKVEEEYAAMTQSQIDDEREPSDEETALLLRKHGIADNGCVPLFNFCVNPRSFGQTVENMFYVSFLIKEGRVGLDFDTHGLPTIGVAQQKSMAERQEAKRNQAVFTLDHDIWRELVDAYGIDKCIIPHRDDGVLWDDGTLPQQRERGRERGRLNDDVDDDVDNDDDDDDG